MTTISYQLYCSRNFPPVEDTLAMLADVGFKEVEGFGGLYDDPAKLKDQLDAAGLKMTTGHFGLAMIEEIPEKALEIARTTGMHSVYVPHIMPDERPKDAAGWAAFGKRLAEAGKPILDAGFRYGWHNHEFEFDNIDGDLLPIEHIAAASADLSLELDLGWVKRAGHDPIEWIKRFGNRISAAHVKDIAPEGGNADEDGWADVGHGIMDWPAIHAALQEAGVSHYVIEHDNPGDHARMARRSFATVSAL